MTEDKSGSAFPCEEHAGFSVPLGTPEYVIQQIRAIKRKTNGLSKREWFAGMDMQGLLACGITQISDHEEIAKQSFSIADAMMKEAGT